MTTAAEHKERQRQEQQLRARVAEANEASTLELPVPLLAHLLAELDAGREAARKLETYEERVREFERTLSREGA